MAFISSPNWRTQKQKAKKRDIFAFCFEREHFWYIRYIYMLNTRYIYFVLLIKGSRMNHFYCLIVVFSFFFTIVTYKEYTQHNKQSSALVSISLERSQESFDVNRSPLRSTMSSLRSGERLKYSFGWETNRQSGYRTSIRTDNECTLWIPRC